MNLTGISTISRDPLENLLGYQLRRASAVVMADLGNALATVALRPTEATMLMVIEANPGCSQSDIGRLLGIKRSNMVPLMAELVKTRLVERTALDGRSHGLELTSQGMTIFAAVRQIIEAHEERVDAMVGARARTSVMEAMHYIRRT